MRPPSHQRAYLIDTDTVVDLVRRLQAQGYPIAWQAERTGRDLEELVDGSPPMLVDEDILIRLRRLARHLGETMASPAPGLPGAAITAAKTTARAAGYYPPAAYDDDGNLVPGAPEGHAWDVADELAEKRLRILELLLQDWRNANIAEDVGLARKTVDRVTAKINEMRPKAGWLTRVHHALKLHAEHEENPTALALHLELLKTNAVAHDHPAHQRADALTNAAAAREAPSAAVLEPAA